MIQTTSATLASSFTHKFIVKAIIPTLKLARADLTSTSSFNLYQFDTFRGQVITLSKPTLSNQSNVTLTLTFPNTLTTYTTTVTFTAGATTIETLNAEDEWVNFTISGNGIDTDTTVTNISFKRLEIMSPKTLSSTFTMSLRKTTQVKIDMASLGIPWVENANYTFAIGEGFVKGVDPDAPFTSPLADIPYSANPPLAIATSNPAHLDGATENNDYIVMEFNRPVSPYIGSNFYFYEYVNGTSTLLKTFNVNSGIVNKKTVTLDVRGLVKPETTYYVLSDDEMFKDADNFVFNGLSNPNSFRYTTVGEPLFRDLISLVFTSGTLIANGSRKLPWTTTALSSAFTPNFRPVKTVRTSKVLSAVATLSKTLMGKRQNPGAKTLPTAFSIVTSVLKVRQAAASLSSAFSKVFNVGMLKGTFVDVTSTSMLAADGLKLVRTSATLSSQFTTYVLGEDTFDVISDPNPYSTATTDYFGYGLSMNDNYILAGAIGEGTPTQVVTNPGYDFVGKAYLFNASTKALLHTFDNPYDYENINYGHSTALTSQYAIVSSLNVPSNGSAGKVYVYNLNDYSLAYTFSNPNPVAEGYDDRYGVRITANDTYLAVNAYYEDDSGLGNNDDAGVVYVYNLTTGTLAYTLRSPSPYTREYFGYSISINGNYLAVGGGDNPTNDENHNVRIYDLTTGNLVRTITDPDQSQFNTSFGHNVEIYGNKVAVSSPGWAKIGAAGPAWVYSIVGGPTKGWTASGKVTVFDIDTGNALYVIEAPIGLGYSPNSSQQFGNAMAMNDDKLVISSRTYNTSVGISYVYSSTSGEQLSTIYNNYGGSFAGSFVAVNSTSIGISAINDSYAIGGQIRIHPDSVYRPDKYSAVPRAQFGISLDPSYTYASHTITANAVSTISKAIPKKTVGFEATLSSTFTISATIQDRLQLFDGSVTSSYSLDCVAINTKPESMTLVYFTDNSNAAELNTRLEFRGATNLIFEWSDGTIQTINAPTNGNGSSIYINKTIVRNKEYILNITPYDNSGITASEMTVTPFPYSQTSFREIKKFGNIAPRYLYVKGHNNFTNVPSSIPTSLNQFSIGSTSFNDPNVINWDVSNMTRFDNMFAGSTSFNQPIGNWNVSLAIEMGSMFNGATSFNQDLTAWCVPMFTTEPIQFGGSPSWTTKPVWGTCPTPTRTAKTVTAVGNTVISSTQSKFGGSSVYFDGTGDYLNIDSNSDFTFGTNPFCMEAWIYKTGGTSYHTIFDMRTSGSDGGGIILGINNSNQIYMYYNFGYRITSPAISNNTWTHVALVRYNGYTKLYINGVQSGVSYVDSNNYAQRGLHIGGDPLGNYNFPGYMDEIRITNRYYRYPGAFTPPTAAFANDGVTKLLIHGDTDISDDAS